MTLRLEARLAPMPVPDAFRAAEIAEAAFKAEAPALSVFEVTPDGPWSIELLFEHSDEPADDLAARAEQALVAEGFAPRVSIAPLVERDWVVEVLATLRPVRAGPFVVHGSHDRAAIAPSRYAIEIDAGRAFGTGHHATTTGCLTALDALARGGPLGSVLDVGTGSGVLAIAAARLGGHPVIGTDLDPVAVRVARENARLNGVAPRVRFVAADAVRHPVVARHAPYDLILANILARPLMAMAPQLAAMAGPETGLVLSGLLLADGPRVFATYHARGFVLERRIARDGWLTLILVHRST